MSNHVGTPALIDDEEIGWVPEPRTRRELPQNVKEAEAKRHARKLANLVHNDQARAEQAARTGRAVVICARCGKPSDPVKRAKNGTAYCHPCADQMVAAFYAQHPEQRPNAAAQIQYKQFSFALVAKAGKVWKAAPCAKDYLGKPMPLAIEKLTKLGATITWLQPETQTRRERSAPQPYDRFVVRWHEGDKRWHIADTRTRRWTTVALRSKEAAHDECATMNLEYNSQRLQELLRVK
jgi:hypothetical protein